jgi:hypothetical protein
MADGFARFTLPNHCCLALVGDPDGGYIFMTDGCTADGVGGNPNLACPDFVGIMFDPSRLWEKLCEFFLGDGNYFS